MNKKSILMQAGLLMGLTLSFTSCDELTGELDNPTPQTPAAVETQKYLVWNATSKALEEQDFVVSDYTPMTSATTEWKGNYIVDSDVDIAADVTLTGDVNIILKDGKTLNVHGKVAGDYKLCIYSQSSDAATAGAFEVAPETAGSGSALAIKDLEIHGGNIIASGHGNSSAGGDDGITTSGKLYIYAGTVKAYGGAASGASGNGGTAISCLGKDFQICLADVTATGGGSTAGGGGIGIYCNGTYYYDTCLQINGGIVNAKAGSGSASYGVYSAITVNSGELYADGNTGGKGVYGPLYWSEGLSTYAGPTTAYENAIDKTTASSIDGIAYQYVRVK